jgi:molybdopterin synthase sulfur carrier subunit
MTIRVLYFAGLRETFGSRGEEVSVVDGIDTVGALRGYIAARGEPWQHLLRSKNLRAAVNQTMADFETAIGDGDEVAFFPPVTGG